MTGLISDPINEETPREVAAAVSELLTEKMNISDFKPIKAINNGGFGILRIVKFGELEKIYAMKIRARKGITQRHQETNGEAERELLTISPESSKWIVRLFYKFNSVLDTCYIFELMSGLDLLDLLIKVDRLSEENARFYFAEIVLAIEEVHKFGMIHRDIKVLNTNNGKQFFIWREWAHQISRFWTGQESGTQSYFSGRFYNFDQ